MRPGVQQQNQQRTPATDFVQEYAAKRQLQIELAKKIREERLHQQGTRDGGGMGAKAKDVLGAPSIAYKPPPMASGIDKIEADRSASSSLVLQVAEEDFKEATKAGIITPDQARQLWAMLSNQLIRVAPSSRESLNTGCFSTTVASLLALSSSQGSPSDVDSTLNKRGFMNSTKKNSHGSDKNVEGKFAFGGSISLESLRQSIAYFKKQMRQEQHASGSEHRPLSDEPNPRHHPAHHHYSDEEDSLEGCYNKPQAPLIRDEEEEMDFRGAYDKRAPAVKSKMATNNHAKKKPDWNSDVNVDGFEGGESGGNDPVPRTAGMTKLLAARIAAQKAGAPSKSQPSGGANKNHRQPQLQYSPHPSPSSHPPRPPSRQSNEESENAREEGGAMWGGNSYPAAPLNLDDVPIHPKGNPNGGYNLKAIVAGAAPARKRKEAGRAAASNSNSSNSHNCNHPSRNPKAMSNHFDSNDDIAAVSGLGGGNDLIAAEASAAAREPTRECAICGRTFRLSILPRHEPLCRKQANKPRKVFNMKAQRLEGVEGAELLRPTGNSYAATRTSHAAAAANPNKIPKWKIQHEQFQAAMRAVHQQKGGAPGGGKDNFSRNGGGGGGYAALPPEFDDRVPCPHCGRKFAEEVAARHIPKCATTVAKPKGIRPIRR
ncbi:unnamed protein product [Phytomonas sp. EM1]|nr:unnamed protein product [Phytomonas sp. EM1]|eukprot:CCW61314.1 unnamed protein product [Phytomonas sp. isolate EM1]